MQIWALKNPPQENEVSFIAESLQNGFSRFGWSYIEDGDLTQLHPKPWNELTDEQTDVYRNARFLLDVKESDWVVHINVPSYGQCIAAQVKGKYQFDQEKRFREEWGIDDFRHTLEIDVNSLVTFDRNDINVLPIISSRLKLQGRYWRVTYQAEFLETIHNIKNNLVALAGNETAEVYYLRKDIRPLLQTITEKIQKNHSGQKLEHFLAQVFRKLPKVEEVIENGAIKGWGTDYGADLIVTYRTGLAVANLERQETLIIQVKSYTGKHEETYAVEQLEIAIEKYATHSALLITTGESTNELQSAITSLAAKTNKPIGLLAGSEVASFILKYGLDIII